jgi:hypothetical protein
MFKEGERGKQGDHGQHGDPGLRGEKGERGARGVSAPRRGLIGYLILSLAIGFALFQSYQQDNELCDNQITNRDVLRMLIAQGDPLDADGKLKLKPGDPAYDYYSTRPAEAMAAHHRNQRTLAEIVPPIKC